eukprot:SAG31_NODE_122_length_23797_cov_39.343812_10_plen_76_part_00
MQVMPTNATQAPPRARAAGDPIRADPDARRSRRAAYASAATTREFGRAGCGPGLVHTERPAARRRCGGADAVVLW